MKRVDLTGQTFGDWYVLEYVGDKKYLCRCNCNLHTKRVVSAYSLTSGKSTGCGHNNNKAKEDYTGSVYGEIRVTGYAGNGKWYCECANGHVTQHRARVFINKENYKCPTCEEIKRQNKNKAIAQHKEEKIQARNLMTPLELAREKGQFKDLTNMSFGDLIAKQYLGDGYWRLECICGLTKDVRGYSLHTGRFDSYRCKHIKLVGERFGRLVVLSRHGDKCLCHCDCGKDKEIDSRNIINGCELSCGCLRSDNLYSKEEVMNTIINYTNSNGEYPYISDLVSLLGVHEGTIRDYIDEYNLRGYINSTYSSRYERDIADVITGIIGKDKLQIHTRKIISPRELDLYIPDLKLAIEINGDYWHSYPKQQDKKYHQKKTLACTQLGIQLIHIFEHDLVIKERRDKIIQFIKERLQYKKQVYNARELEVKECDINLLKDFLDKNHLQGFTGANIALVIGNREQGVLGVMTFGKPRFNNSNTYEYELIRLCFKSGIIINGGAKKLFKYFIDKYKPTSILSYCDISKFTGNVYNNLGFKLEKITDPNYVWFNIRTKDLLTRYQTKKQTLIDKSLGKEDDTEDDIMYSNGYVKVYDSGNIKYVWNSKDE